MDSSVDKGKQQVALSQELVQKVRSGCKPREHPDPGLLPRLSSVVKKEINA